MPDDTTSEVNDAGSDGVFENSGSVSSLAQSTNITPSSQRHTDTIDMMQARWHCRSMLSAVHSSLAADVVVGSTETGARLVVVCAPH